MLKNKTIIVTGGAGRLGKEFSKGIVEHQGKVIIADIYSNLLLNCYNVNKLSI